MGNPLPVHNLHRGWCCDSFRLYDTFVAGTEVDLLSAEILRVHPDEPQPDRIDYIVSCLRKGNLVAMPTDTFYGLAVDPVNLHAVEQIYQLKTQAEAQTPLPAHFLAGPGLHSGSRQRSDA